MASGSLQPADSADRWYNQCPSVKRKGNGQHIKRDCKMHGSFITTLESTAICPCLAASRRGLRIWSKSTPSIENEARISSEANIWSSSSNATQTVFQINNTFTTLQVPQTFSLAGTPDRSCSTQRSTNASWVLPIAGSSTERNGNPPETPSSDILLHPKNMLWFCFIGQSRAHWKV